MVVQTKTTSADNGVNVEALMGIREALANSSQAARCIWRAECEWMNGMHCRSVVTDFFGLDKERTHKASYTIDTDHPECFAGEDNAATPTELVLAALASCLTGGVASIAQNSDIQLRAVTTRVEANMGVYSALGMDTELDNSFNAIRVSFDIESDASRDDIKAIVAQAQNQSALFDIIVNPRHIKITVN